MCVFQCMRVLCGGSGVWIISPWVLFREASRAWGGEEKGDIVVVQMNVIGASENRFTHGGFSRNKLATSAWPLRLWPCLNPFYEGIKCINCHGLASVCRLLLIGVRSQRKKRQCVKSVFSLVSKWNFMTNSEIPFFGRFCFYFLPLAPKPSCLVGTGRNIPRNHLEITFVIDNFPYLFFLSLSHTQYLHADIWFVSAERFQTTHHHHWSELKK